MRSRGVEADHKGKGPAQQVRPRPPLFRALGAREAPPRVEIDGSQYTRVAVFKHDSWAATALYEGPAGKVVCKFNRQHAILGVPMGWLGRLLARREDRMLRRLADLPNVPRPTGPVRVAGRVVEGAVAHRYVAGHPLASRESLGDHFFPRLQALLAELHRRGIAYVDLHKRENILVGDDGEPYLIDFQISVALPAHRWPGGAILRVLQRFDTYSLLKHFAWHRPDQCGMGPEAVSRERSRWITAHRMVAVPFRTLRRRLLGLLGIRDGRGQALSEHFPEDAVRRELAQERLAG